MTEKEALAVIWAMKHWRHYIYGLECTVITDHSALRSALTIPTNNVRLAKWGLMLQEYQGLLKIVYRKGRLHENADALSRKRVHHPDSEMQYEGNAPNFAENVSAEAETHFENLLAAAREQPKRDIVLRVGNDQGDPNLEKEFSEDSDSEDDSSEPNFSGFSEGEVSEAEGRKSPLLDSSLEKNLEEALDSDPFSKAMKNFLEQEIISDDPEIATKVVAMSAVFGCVNDKLYFSPKGQDQLLYFIPPKLRVEIISMHHDTPEAAHMGIKKTLGRLKQNFYWPAMVRDVNDYVRTCHECQLRKPYLKGMKPPLHPWEPVYRPFDFMSMDCAGPFPETLDGNRYYIIATDWLSKFVIVEATVDIKADTLCKFVMERIVGVFAMPTKMLTDKAPTFLGTTFQTFCQDWRIEHLHTAPYAPWTDGRVEKGVHIITKALSFLVDEKQDTWDRGIPVATLAYNSSPHTANDKTPL